MLLALFATECSASFCAQFDASLSQTSPSKFPQQATRCPGPCGVNWCLTLRKSSTSTIGSLRGFSFAHRSPRSTSGTVAPSPPVPRVLGAQTASPQAVSASPTATPTLPRSTWFPLAPTTSRNDGTTSKSLGSACASLLARTTAQALSAAGPRTATPCPSPRIPIASSRFRNILAEGHNNFSHIHRAKKI